MQRTLVMADQFDGPFITISKLSDKFPSSHKVEVIQALKALQT